MSSEATDTKKSREELQSLWKVPSIAQFVSLFYLDFKLPEMDIEVLEDGLLNESIVGCHMMKELLLGLLRGITSRSINDHNFDQYLQKQIWKISRSDPSLNIPLSEDISFFTLNIFCKVDVLYALCLMRLDRPSTTDAISKMDGDALRMMALGTDNEGNEYWYFFGTRLYKQEPLKENNTKKWNNNSPIKKKRGRGRPKKMEPPKSVGDSNGFDDVKPDTKYLNVDQKSRWSVVCNTIEDWVEFAEKFKNSRSTCEKNLFETVTFNFLPSLSELYKDKERKLRQKLHELTRHVPTKRETRQQKLKLLHENDPDFEDEKKAKERASRLEERNRRMSDSEGRLRKRARTLNYADGGEEEDFEVSNNSYREQRAQEDEYRRTHMPEIDYQSSSDLKTLVIDVMQIVKMQKDAVPFLFPIPENNAPPGYYEIISRPTDLKTITDKINNNKYEFVSDIDDEFKRLVENWRIYSGPNSSMEKMAANLWKAFRKGIADIIRSSKFRERELKLGTYSSEEESNAKHKKSAKKGNNLLNSKRKKKPTNHMDALEVLSKQSQIALEKSSQPNGTRTQISSNYSSMYSDLKVEPICDHPSALIEKLRSYSSNDDSSDSGNDSSSSDHNTSLHQVVPEEDIRSSPDPTTSCYQVEYVPGERPKSSDAQYQSDGGSDLGGLIDTNNPKGFNILSDGEGNGVSILSDNDDFPYVSKSDKLGHGISNIIDDDGNGKDINSSPSKGSVSSLSAGSPRGSSPMFGQPPVVEKNVPFLQEGFCRYSPPSEVSTVDASSVGIMTDKRCSIETPVHENAAHRSDDANNSSEHSPQGDVPKSNFFADEATSVNQPADIIATNPLPTTMSNSLQMIPFSKAILSPVSYLNGISPPRQISPTLSSSTQGNIMVQNAEGNKLQTMKLSLPPSTGEILVVPGDQSSSGMMFHLFAQPNTSPNHTIQPNVDLQSSNNFQAQSVNPGVNNVQKQPNLVPRKVLPKESNTKRKSPIQELLSSIPPPTSSLFQIGSMPRDIHSGFATVPRTYEATLPSPMPTMSYGSGIRPSAMKPSIFGSDSSDLPFSNGGSVFKNTSSPQYDAICQKTIPGIFPGNYTLSSAPGSTMPKPRQFQMPKNFVPMQFPSNGFPSGFTASETMKKPVGMEQQSTKMAHGTDRNGNNRMVPDMVTCASYYAPSNSMLQSFPMQNNPMNTAQVYTQVLPSQVPQYLNNPYYIVADPSTFHSQARYPVMNVQHIPFANR